MYIGTFFSWLVRQDYQIPSTGYQLNSIGYYSPLIYDTFSDFVFMESLIPWTALSATGANTTEMWFNYVSLSRLHYIILSFSFGLCIAYCIEPQRKKNIIPSEKNSNVRQKVCTGCTLKDLRRNKRAETFRGYYPVGGNHLLHDRNINDANRTDKRVSRHSQYTRPTKRAYRDVSIYVYILR